MGTGCRLWRLRSSRLKGLPWGVGSVQRLHGGTRSGRRHGITHVPSQDGSRNYGFAPHILFNVILCNVWFRQKLKKPCNCIGIQIYRRVYVHALLCKLELRGFSLEFNDLQDPSEIVLNFQPLNTEEVVKKRLQVFWYCDNFNLLSLLLLVKDWALSVMQVLQRCVFKRWSWSVPWVLLKQ